MLMTGDCVNRQDGPDGKVVIFLSLNDGGMFITPGEVLSTSLICLQHNSKDLI